MYRQVTTYLALSIAFARLIYAQDVLTGKLHPIKDADASLKVKSLDELSKTESKTTKDYIDTRNISEALFFSPPQNEKTRTGKTKEKGLQSLISSFRSNIRFGGFWDNHAIIDFSPSVFLRPFDFISIYGNQNTSYFIPLQEVKYEMKTLCIQGAAILTVDNVCRFLLGSDELIPAAANFVLKTVVMELLKSSIGGKQNSEVSRENSFYYSVSIRF